VQCREKSPKFGRKEIKYEKDKGKEQRERWMKM
jgi:hypothetical protein